MTKTISRERFDLFAIGTRRSQTALIAEEISFWSDLDENVLGVVFRDKIDDDFGWSLLVRDRIGRFRAVDLNVSISNIRRAEAELRLAIAEVARHKDLSEYGIQGDETNNATDLLSVLPGTLPDQLHPYFKIVLDDPGREPARAVLKALGPWLAIADPHFVREFQRHQFDQRLWELYLWAALRETGYDLERVEAPDFICRAPWADFAVEATTVAPSSSGVLSEHPNPSSPPEMIEFLRGYMPIKFASALTSKLSRRSSDGKHYWEETAAADLPFLIAVADFHKPATSEQLGSMLYTGSAIAPYLYGIEYAADGAAKKIDTHNYKEKTIPSNFFGLEGSENVSAVLFSNAGTIAKFERIGVRAGFAPPNHLYVREGTILRAGPHGKLEDFRIPVSHELYSEKWADELQIFHNPHANRPLPLEAFSSQIQHFWENDDIVSYVPRDLILSSSTNIIRWNQSGASEEN